MPGKRLVGAGALALMLTAGVGGPAQAADATAAQDYTTVQASGTVAKPGDQVIASCPAGLRAQYGLGKSRDGGVKRTHYRSEPTSDGTGWIVRVVSTEMPAPWTLDVNLTCSVLPEGFDPLDQDFIETSETVTTSDREVVAYCPAGYKAVSGVVRPEWKIASQGVTSDGNGLSATACDWFGESFTANVFFSCRQ